MPATSPSGGINIKGKLEDVHFRLAKADDRFASHDGRISKLEEASKEGGDNMGEMVKMLNDRIDSEVNNIYTMSRVYTYISIDYIGDYYLKIVVFKGSRCTHA